MSNIALHRKMMVEQIKEIKRAQRVIRLANPLHSVSPLNILGQVNNRLALTMGFGKPKPITLLLKLIGLSPGSVTLWHDSESGWLAEGRVVPGSPPVYRYVGDDIAMAILNEALTPEQKAFLWTPDPYLGE